MNWLVYSLLFILLGFPRGSQKKKNHFSNILLKAKKPTNLILKELPTGDAKACLQKT